MKKQELIKKLTTIICEILIADNQEKVEKLKNDFDEIVNEDGRLPSPILSDEFLKKLYLFTPSPEDVGESYELDLIKKSLIKDRELLELELSK